MRLSLLAVLLYLFIPSSVVQAQESMLLKTALDEAFVTASFTGNEASIHYFQPLKLELKNQENRELTVLLNAGRIIHSEDPTDQDILITKGEEITLKSLEEKTVYLYGMCIQEFNAAPHGASVYQLGDMAEGNLRKLAERIRKEKAYGIAAQQAVWALTNGRPLAAIESIDLQETQAARDMVLDLVSTETTTFAGQSVRRRSTETLIKRQMEGNFKYNLNNDAAVTIGLFNQDNIVMKELFNQSAVKRGEHDFAYTLDAMIDPAKTYYIRLIIDGEIKINFEMKPRRS